MAAHLCRLHHISLHVSNVNKIVHDLRSKFNFDFFAARLTEKTGQYAFRRGSAVFLVNEKSNPVGHELNERGSQRELPSMSSFYNSTDNRVRFGDKTSDIRKLDFLYDHYPHYSVDTVCNVCFEVEDVERSFNALRDQGCQILVPPKKVHDDNGLVTYFVVKSIVGNVYHTLLDRSKYHGMFLPQFDELDSTSELRSVDASLCPITHFDHITYACPRRNTAEVMRWYEKHFGFQRFFIDSNEDMNEGYVLDQDGVGLRLTAMEYWKCSEMGIQLPSKNRMDPDCKFVIAESLPEQGKNQVDTFLEQHRGPGIQHIGLYTTDIVRTAQTMAQAGVEFFTPPPAYYTEVGKRHEIESAGHDPQMLSKHGILLDTALNKEAMSQPPSERYLLQIFTKPIFAEDTFFLELIERRGATGFGEGNIRALWRSVQAYMENEKEDTQKQKSDVSLKTGKC
ncbi:4-hydroxyphenylpyruvate dioxygenase-like protein isoform X2 [Clupea harengus]|uniref:4-hydroxyphenylpyruvate dioxygenase n=1 Tax=Clupea harengus TaxID=7950 RepID=A0A8M1KEB6_CLUHA|nr:4-hydroxyphenylpyruvate dioxygenase-like protein isoform X2 [Clupea harengus]